MIHAVAPLAIAVAAAAEVSIDAVFDAEIRAAEVVAFDAASSHAIVAADDRLVAVRLAPGGLEDAWAIEADDAAPGLAPGATFTHAVSDPSGRGVVAAVVRPARFAHRKGRVVFIAAATGEVLGDAPVGYGPDAAAFSPDGNLLVVANEGEFEIGPGGVTDPPGSVSIIEIPPAMEAVAKATTHDVPLRAAAGLRIHPRNAATPELDLEPEYVAILGRRAFVSLQENSAVAVIDLDRREQTGLLPLSPVRRAIDPSDRDGTRDADVEVMAWPMPDQLAAFSHDGRDYLVLAEEGDDRGDLGDHPLADAARLSDLRKAGRLGPRSLERLREEPRLERLEVCAFSGDTDGDGLIDEPHALGARGVAVIDIESGQRADAFDRNYLRALPPSLYHSSAPELEFDSRSDNRGAEPEGVVIGEAHGRRLAFVTFERPGLLLTLDLTDPSSPRSLSLTLPGHIESYGPEGMCFIPAASSPLGEPTVLVACEASGRLVAYQVRPPTR